MLKEYTRSIHIGNKFKPHFNENLNFLVPYLSLIDWPSSPIGVNAVS